MRALQEVDLTRIVQSCMDLEFTEHPHFLSLRNSLCIAKNVTFTTIHVNIRAIRKHWDQFKIITAGVQNVVDPFVLT